MIILFDDNEIKFTGLGIGVLRDAKSCIVKEELNDSFEVQLTYPITGALYDKIELNKIILCKSNPYSEMQPFRIYSISKPINGIVTISAFHISYDMNGIPVKPVDGKSVKDTLDKIQDGALIKHNFKLYTDKTDTKTFKTNGYFNMRSLLLGSNDSVLEKYEGDILFDKFNVYLLKQRGSNKGAQVRYAKNLKDITHEISYDRLYNGVYPYFHQESTSQSSSSNSDGFKQVYIVGSKPYQDGWLSYTKDGEPYHPIDESPVQIATEGNFYQKVYCWNSLTQRYVEKIYNETVTLIDQVGNLLNSADTPSWIYIDWSKIPLITCKAKADGYFKSVSDTEWVYHKNGEVIFENSIKEVATNIMLYYSEVIPTSSTSEIEETTTVTHIELDDKIIYLDTDAAKEMKFDRILCLDLTSEFKEAPTKDDLEKKAKEFIEKNKIGQYKYNTTVSFVDLSATTEGVQYKNIEQIELGDIVKVVYDALGVNIDLRVISTDYNVLLNRYEKIELGEKPEKISGESVQNGDNISSLTNDVGYADITTVNKLIAKTITADYIKALDAKLSKAQIDELSTARIKVSGLIEATQFELDTLVAKMLTADNAKIKETLEAGTIKVAGDVTITKGEINIISTADDGTSIVFRVDRSGNVTANSVTITGGELNINDTFTVTPDGILSAQGAQISGDIQILSGSIQIGNKFQVSNDGTVTATGATISGDISADTGHIAGFTIENNRLEAGNNPNKVLVSPGYYYKIDEPTKYWSFISGYDTTSNTAKFKVANDGSVYAKELYITGGELNIGTNFIVDSSGKLTMKSGSITIKNGLETKFNVSDTGVVTAADMNITGGSISIKDSSNVENFKVTNQGLLTAKGVTIQNGSISIGESQGNPVFYVDTDGNLTATSVNITGGQLHIQGSSSNFEVSNDGTLTAVNANILGRITATEGYIGSTEYGFTIKDNAIYNGVYNIISTKTLYGGIYLGSDAIILGQDSSSGKVTIKSYFGIDEENGVDINISNYSGGIFEITYNSALIDREIYFIPSDSSYAPLSDVSNVNVILPKNTTRTTFSLNSSKYFRAFSRSGSGIIQVMYLYSISVPMFMVDRYGDTVMRNATVKGTIESQSGNIAGFTIDNNSMSKNTPGTSGSVLMSIGTTNSYTIGGKTQTGWCFSAGQNFGVDTSGNLYSTAGYIGGFQINSNKIGILPDDPDKPTNRPYGITTDGTGYFNTLYMVNDNIFTCSILFHDSYDRKIPDINYWTGEGYTDFYPAYFQEQVYDMEGGYVPTYITKYYATLLTGGNGIALNDHMNIKIIPKGELTSGSTSKTIQVENAVHFAMACTRGAYDFNKGVNIVSVEWSGRNITVHYLQTYQDILILYFCSNSN